MHCVPPGTSCLRTWPGSCLRSADWYRGERRPVEARRRRIRVLDDKVAVELKSVDKILPIHQAQLLTYLRLSSLRVGLLMNFNVRMLKDEILRRVL